jgi:N-methylhydantoinase B
MGVVLFGKGTRAPMSLGIFGGYPGCNVGYSTFRDANVDELPSSLETTRGAERTDRFWGHIELNEGDIQYVRFMGGGGYGDPIDRDPQLVLDDVLRGLVTEEAARGIYGVAVDGERVDGAATAERRRALRSERLGHEVDGPDERRPIESTGMPISEYLQRTPGGVQCTWCGTELAPSGSDWKQHAVLRRVPVARAGPLRADAGEFFMIEACCPSCGTLLDVDLAAGDDGPLHDRIQHWPRNGS